MPADFGFITHAAEGNAHKLAAKRIGNRTSERSLANAAAQRNKGSADVPFSVSRNAQQCIPKFFSLAFFKLYDRAPKSSRHFLRPDYQAKSWPTAVHDPINIGADDAHFGRHRRHLIQAFQFLHCNVLRLFGQICRVHFFFKSEASRVKISPSPNSVWICFICSRR